MKKLMIAMVAAAMVGAANAEASYDYTFTANNLGSSYNGYAILKAGSAWGALMTCDDGAKAFVSDGLLSDTYWSMFGAKTWAEFYSAMTESQPLGTVSGGSGSTTEYDSENIAFAKYSVAFILFKNGITPGSDYVLLETVYYNGAGTMNPTFDMTGAKVIQSGKLMTDSAPEPTSGLLMLLGMAGLALKRKRA